MKHRTLSMAGAGLLALMATSQPARAHAEEPAQQQQQAQPAQRPQAQAEQLVGARDAETGQARPATPEEIAALQAAKLRSRLTSLSSSGRAQPQVLRHASGAVGARTTDEMVSYSVGILRADGSVTEACLTSKSAAEEAMKAITAPIAPVARQSMEK